MAEELSIENEADFCEKEIIIGNTCFGYDGGLPDSLR